MPSSCPICNRPLKPALTNALVYAILGDGNHLLGALKAYRCERKEHITIMAESGNGVLRTAETRPVIDGVTHPKILNSWKEIAVYLKSGVRTVQRLEVDLGLPVHRPKGVLRGPVLAFAEELDAWLSRSPVRHTAEMSQNAKYRGCRRAERLGSSSNDKGSERRSIVPWD